MHHPGMHKDMGPADAAPRQRGAGPPTGTARGVPGIAGRGMGRGSRSGGRGPPPPPAAVDGQIRTPQVPDCLAVKAAAIATRRGAPARRRRLRACPPRAAGALRVEMCAGWRAGRLPAGARPPRRRRGGRRSPAPSARPTRRRPSRTGQRRRAACGGVRHARGAGIREHPALRRCGIPAAGRPRGPVDRAPAGRGRIYKGATRRRRGPDKAAGEH